MWLWKILSKDIGLLKVIPKRIGNRITPRSKRKIERMLNSGMAQQRNFIGFMASCIYSVISNHFKMLFGNISDKSFDESHNSAECFEKYIV